MPQSKEMLTPRDVILVAHLPFGEGHIGERYRLPDTVAEEQFADDLSPYARLITIENTADCVDDRPTIALGDGTDDPHQLAARVTYQLPGGLGLATTKAALGADAAYLRDAKNFQQAYEVTVNLLLSLGYDEAGHEGCGASKNVESSVVNELSEDLLGATVPALVQNPDQIMYYIGRNQETKRQRLENGFYGGWSAAWHESFLADRFSHNFSILADNPEDELTRGHDASGLLIVNKSGHGFAKTAFHNEKHSMAFGFTPKIATEIAHKLGGSNEERARIQLEFGIDPSQVLNGLVTASFPAFATGE